MSVKTKTLTYLQRAKLTNNPCAQKLFQIVEEKETNLALSADLTTFEKLFKLADLLGPKIALLKTHIDLLEDFQQEQTTLLQELAKKHNFLIFEDRKFADIGNTVKNQYQKGIYHIADWADITNAHPLPGSGIIEGLKEVGLPRGRALLLLAQMSSKDNLITEEYTKQTIEMANEHSDFVIGFISRQKLTNDPRFIHMTPGVKLEEGKDKLGQQYLTPEKVLFELESDLIIVGRGIITNPTPFQEAEKYRQSGWEAYLKRIVN